jgi:cobalt-precorrin 5A hydrolase/precorrin-3B C17-methyltransferase
MVMGLGIESWRRRLTVGIGCDRDAPLAELRALLLDCLREAKVGLRDIGCLATIDAKADETGILDLAAELGLPLQFFPAADLERETPRLANPSEAVFRAIGCHGVAEAAALAALGPAAYLLLPKRRSVRATCALAALPVDQPADLSSSDRQVS